VLDDPREDNVFIQHNGKCTYHEKWKCYMPKVSEEKMLHSSSNICFRRDTDMRQRNKFTEHAYTGMRNALVKNPFQVYGNLLAKKYTKKNIIL
jgi:hypothetical protein